MTFGPHLIGELKDCIIPRSPDWPAKFLPQLAARINMLPIGDVHIDHYSGPEPWHGPSATLHIQTSHITLHAFERTDFVFLDIFSCREFDVDAAIDFIWAFFEPLDDSWTLLQRGRLFG